MNYAYFHALNFKIKFNLFSWLGQCSEMRFFPSLTVWKTFNWLTESFFNEYARNFQELLFKVWRIECWISFFSKCVTVKIKKIKDIWRQYWQKKRAQKGWNWLMRPTLTRFLEYSLAFMKKWITPFDLKIYNGRVLQIYPSTTKNAL